MTDTTQEDARQMLTEAANGFTARHLRPAALRACEPNGFDHQLWQEVIDLGLPALLLPEDVGGLGLGLKDYCAMVSVMGKALHRLPLAPFAIGSMAALGAPQGPLRERLIEAVLGGAVLAPAFAEGHDATLPARFTTTARSDGIDLRLTGRKVMVAPAQGAAGYMVGASDDAGEMLLVFVDAKAQGLTITQQATVTNGALATLVFDDMRVPDTQIIARGRPALESLLDVGALVTAADLLGVIHGAFAMTMDYLATRKQFGHALGSFQALQHRAADLYLQQTLAEVSLDSALDEQSARSLTTRHRAASRAKARTSAAALTITKEGIQMHGGIGFTDEHDIGLYLKQALVLQASFGNAAEHRRRYIQQGAAA